MNQQRARAPLLARQGLKESGGNGLEYGKAALFTGLYQQGKHVVIKRGSCRCSEVLQAGNYLKTMTGAVYSAAMEPRLWQPRSYFVAESDF